MSTAWGLHPTRTTLVAPRGRAMSKSESKDPVMRSEAAAHSIAASYLAAAALMIRVPDQQT